MSEASIPLPKLLNFSFDRFFPSLICVQYGTLCQITNEPGTCLLPKDNDVLGRKGPQQRTQTLTKYKLQLSIYHIEDNKYLRVKNKIFFLY